MQRAISASIGNPPESVELCRNKLRQREALHRANLPVPEFFGFCQAENLDSVIARVKFPCVLKPLSLSASQGVIRANNEKEFREAVRRIRKLAGIPGNPSPTRTQSRSHSGRELHPGKGSSHRRPANRWKSPRLAIFDKPDPLEGPFFEETIYVTPSRLPDSDQRALIDCAEQSVAALGLITGPIHAEFRINENGPWIIEIAPRPIGGLCARALRFGNERISLEELILRHALGWKEAIASRTIRQQP